MKKSPAGQNTGERQKSRQDETVVAAHVDAHQQRRDQKQNNGAQLALPRRAGAGSFALAVVRMNNHVERRRSQAFGVVDFAAQMPLRTDLRFAELLWVCNAFRIVDGYRIRAGVDPIRPRSEGERSQYRDFVPPRIGRCRGGVLRPMSETHARRDSNTPEAPLDTGAGGHSEGPRPVHIRQQTKRRTKFDKGLGSPDSPPVLAEHGKLPSRAVVRQLEDRPAVRKENLHRTT
jgi:hypothetical protein